jgi:non-heme chloroperoxidase
MTLLAARDGTAIHYRDWGRGDVIVFSHGWGLGGDCWEYQALPLSRQGFRCVTFDRRGCGGSEDSGRGHNLDTYADDLASLLDRLQLERVTLVGHSMGCGEILRYLTAHGDARVARLVLVAPSTPYLLVHADNPNGLPQAFFDGMKQAVMNDRAGFMEVAAPAFFGVGLPGVEVSDAQLRWGIAMAMRASGDALVAMIDVYSSADHRPDLFSVRVPCLIIHGDNDVEPTTLERCGRPTAAGIKGSELRVYEGAPHGLFLSHRARLNTDLVEFIRSKRP